MTTATDKLRRENERLRAEVERLSRILYPPPPEPEPEPEPKPTIYVFGSHRSLTQVVLSQIQQHYRAEARWLPAYELDDIPEGASVVYVHDYVSAGFGKLDFPGGNILYWKRTADKLTFTPTDKQRQAFVERADAVFAGVNDLLRVAETASPAHGYGYGHVVDVALASLNLALVQFTHGEPWVEAMANAEASLVDDRARVDAAIEARLAT